MGVIIMEYVIRCSSQDPVFKADNLLDPDLSKPWLCSREDKSSSMEAEIQLDGEYSFDFIDLGNCGSNTVEIQVGKSSPHQKTNYVSLLPTSELLSLADISKNLHQNSVFMFNRSHMNKNIAEEKWDRVKVICSRTYFNKKKQFGLTFLSMRNKETLCMSNWLIRDCGALARRWERRQIELSKNGTPDAEPMTRGQQMLIASKPKQIVRPIESTRKTEEQLYFIQLEEDIANFLIACAGDVEVGIKSVRDYLKEFEQQCQHTLTLEEKELFCNKYREMFLQVKQSHLKKSFLRDDSRKRSAPKCVSSSTVAKKLSNSPIIINLRKETEQVNSSSIQEKTSISSVSSEVKNKFPSKQQKDSKASKTGVTRPEDFIQPDGMQPSTSSGITFGDHPVYVDCPLCRESFLSSEIERHASTCGDTSASLPYELPPGLYGDELPSEDFKCPFFKCPFCGRLFSESQINIHANQCIN